MTFSIKMLVLTLVVAGGMFFAIGGQVPRAEAQITVTPGVCSNCPGGSPQCVTFGFSAISTAAIQQALQQVLEEVLSTFTNWFSNIFNNFIGGLLTSLNNILEMQFISWQDNWVAYDLIPAMQDMMGQLNTAYVDSARMTNSGIDGAIYNNTVRTIQEYEADTLRAARPHEQLCVPASIAGSNFARAYTIGRAMRRASERMFTHRGMGESDFTMASLGIEQATMQNDLAQAETQSGLQANRYAAALDALGNPNMDENIIEAQAPLPSYAAGPEAHNKYQFARYCLFLAKPGDNGGHNGCPNGAGNPATQGMDVNPTKYLFNSLVIDTTDPAVEKGLEAMKENLTGLKPPPLIPASFLNSGAGHQAMIDQRSYIARQNAARSVVEFIASTRLPAAKATDLVKELRESAGIPLSSINPDKTSYKEIMHVLSTEKFATGKYNLDMVGEVENVKRESLILSVFYLMQLRDYYELMERGLLTLAVQTAIELGAETSGEGGTGASTSPAAGSGG